MEPYRPMNAQLQKFVEAYCKGMKPKEAAVEAGYAPRSAGIVAKRLLSENKNVQNAIQKFNDEAEAAGRDGVVPAGEAAKFDYLAAMAECDEGIAFAKLTNNAMAHYKFSEMKARLSKLLEKDTGIEASGFQINIVGLQAPGQTQLKAVEQAVESLGSIFD